MDHDERRRAYQFLLFTLSLLLLVALGSSVDTGLWNDETVANTMTQTVNTYEVCIGTTCNTTYQLSIESNASIANSPVCSAANGECATSRRIYGEMWQHSDAGYVQAMYNASAYLDLENYTQGELYGVNYSSGQLVITTAGTYRAVYHIGFTGAKNNKLWEPTINVNSVRQQNCETHRKIGTGGDQGSAMATCMLNLSVSDAVNIGMQVDDGSETLTIYGSNINIVLVET